mmetsp:Transcript_55635/g.120145  ORF Transcript_55635/g.120145 Transcript_55635/m.120145 type:complete len:369 (-) Transcript_55635:282-1388(-)|eukprot:CAMPEP_0170597360 /NCGR_PEP_ID=MMETSP0224-20130122/15667_1 /TAXON_ID=285029 /ORGANISM="Togula jolla, Strain CCCM 725" /LENGTH=368 /DNA_ID=CAMNT_0010921829 /DNA_START=83 /DNA_END=1189 /DNA_ORIENTATION=+
MVLPCEDMGRGIYFKGVLDVTSVCIRLVVVLLCGIILSTLNGSISGAIEINWGESNVMNQGNFSTLYDDCYLLLRNVTTIKGPSLDSGLGYDFSYVLGLEEDRLGHGDGPCGVFEDLHEVASWWEVHSQELGLLYTINNMNITTHKDVPPTLWGHALVGAFSFVVLSLMKLAVLWYTWGGLKVADILGFSKKHAFAVEVFAFYVTVILPVGVLAPIGNMKTYEGSTVSHVMELKMDTFYIFSLTTACAIFLYLGLMACYCRWPDGGGRPKAFMCGACCLGLYSFAHGVGTVALVLFAFYWRFDLAFSFHFGWLLSFNVDMLQLLLFLVTVLDTMYAICSFGSKAASIWNWYRGRNDGKTKSGSEEAAV